MIIFIIEIITIYTLVFIDCIDESYLVTFEITKEMRNKTTKHSSAQDKEKLSW